MGGQRQFLKEGGFSEYLYHQVGDTVFFGGIEGKIIERYNSKGQHEGLPTYSNTSKVYFKIGDKDGRVEQARIYKDRKPAIDIDWGHGHNGFESGVAHVHEWEVGKTGKPTRTGRKRYMNKDEIRQFGGLLKMVAPHVRFRCPASHATMGKLIPSGDSSAGSRRGLSRRRCG